MATVPLSFRWDPEFVARIDAARRTSSGDISRSAFVRRAVEQALSDGPEVGSSAVRQEPQGSVSARSGVPAERPRRSSAVVKRDVRPIPKGKKS